MPNREFCYDSDTIFSTGKVDEHGNLIKKTPEEYPYSYDGFVTYIGGENSEANHTVYSDRIHTSKEYEEACQKVFHNSGQMFFNRSPNDIEKFLRLFYKDKSLKLILVMQCCNVSNGFPLWRFDIKTK